MNPLVTGDPHIRFHAGASLAARDGHLLGTIRVIDHEPHTLTPPQTEALRIVGRPVIANSELRRDLHELKDALAARDAAERASAGFTANLDDVILRLCDAVSNLETARENKGASETIRNLSVATVFFSATVHDLTTTTKHGRSSRACNRSGHK